MTEIQGYILAMIISIGYLGWLFTALALYQARRNNKALGGKREVQKLCK